MDALDKWRNENKSLTPERKAINEALALVTRTETTEVRAATRQGRLVFILDLTSSREPGLKRARLATAAMFDALKVIGAISVKLIYFRAAECKAGTWENDPASVSRAMQKLKCEAGGTQIGGALQHVLNRENEPVSAVVYIGDHFEEDEDEIAALATKLGKKQTPIFVFHECGDDDKRVAHDKLAFKGMAAASGGVYSEFNTDSADELRELLSTVAAFSTAGAEGLKQMVPAITPQAQKLQTLLLLGPGGDLKGDK